MHLDIVEMHPHRPVGRKQLPDLLQPVAHHRQPDGVLQRVVVVDERLPSVEGRVEVGKLDLADDLVAELGQAR